MNVGRAHAPSLQGFGDIRLLRHHHHGHCGELGSAGPFCRHCCPTTPTHSEASTWWVDNATFAVEFRITLAT